MSSHLCRPLTCSARSGVYSLPVTMGALDGNSFRGPLLPVSNYFCYLKEVLTRKHLQWARALDAMNTHDDAFKTSASGGITVCLFASLSVLLLLNARRLDLADTSWIIQYHRRAGLLDQAPSYSPALAYQHATREPVGEQQLPIRSDDAFQVPTYEVRYIVMVKTIPNIIFRHACGENPGMSLIHSPQPASTQSRSSGTVHGNTDGHSMGIPASVSHVRSPHHGSALKTLQVREGTTS